MIKKINFTKNLKNFHIQLFKTNWKKSLPNTLFFRDYEGLPDCSPFDIDILMKQQDLFFFIKKIKEFSKKNNLHFTIKRTSSYCLVLLFDITIEKNKRNWSFFEIRHSYYLNKNKQLEIGKIKKKNVNGIPIPDERWSFFFYFHQMLRKKKIEYFSSLKQDFLKNKKISSVLLEEFEMSFDKLESFFLGEISIDNLRQKFNLDFCNYESKKNSMTVRIKKNIVNFFIFKQFYVNNIFTICGPDGVGKSTALMEIDKIFSIYPFNLKNFHHSEVGNKKRTNITKLKIKKTNFRNFLSFIYLRMPYFFKEFWVYTLHYYSYVKKINRFVLKNHYENNIILLDRYIHDLWCKDLISKNKMSLRFLMNFIYGTFCRLIFKPKMFFIFKDKALNIYKRKKELTLGQIEEYNNVLLKKLNKQNYNYTIISITNKKPKDVAKEVIANLLKSLGEDAFLLLKKKNYQN